MQNNGKPLRKEQRTALEEFIEDKDRGKAAIFIGRKAELAHVQACVNRLMRRRDSAAPGIDLTTVIQGAPGAGKSALLEKIAEDWPPGGKGKPAAIRLAAVSLELPMAELLAIVSRKAGEHSGIQQTLARFRSFSLSLPAMADVTVGMNSSQADEKPLTPIILLFDEIQSVLLGADLHPQTNLTKNIRLLHTGEHGAPVFPIYGGLANSADLLQAAGLTRLALGSELTLPGFCDDEMNELMTRFVEALLSSARPSQAVIDCWGKALRRDSQGWPMHCKNFLIALCQEIRDKDWRPHAVDLDIVRMRAHRLRCAWYERRMQGVLEGRYALVSIVLEEINRYDGMGKMDVVETIARAHQERISEGSVHDSLPEGMTAEQAFAAMLHAGVIQKADEFNYVCPIPSLGSHVAARAMRPPSPLHEAVLRAGPQDIDRAVQRCRDDGERAKLLQATDIRGRTPLILAVELGMAPVVERLAQTEGSLPQALQSIEFRDNDGWTAQDHAVASGDERIMALLHRLQSTGPDNENAKIPVG